MSFYNREEEVEEMKAVLSGEPNLFYFVYGPINSGKTALLMKVFEELPEEYRVFYINFRGRYIQSVEDLIKVLFRVKEKREKLREFLKSVIRGGVKLVEEVSGIPISESIFNMLFQEVSKVEDIFAFLEDYFRALKEEKRVIFVLDEMQTIKELINEAGRSVIQELFNFMVRLTKETHLCHCLCATSDCLFIENVYSNARLEGRAEYILVDDLNKEEAFRVYEEFGFKEKDLVWEYIGGKLGDIIKFFEKKKRGKEEKDALSKMLKDEVARLEWIKLKNLRKKEDGKEIWEFLLNFRDTWEIDKRKMENDFEKLLFWIEENVLFYNPVDGTVRPQSRLIQKAIRELVED